ncbi:SBBP repeat-containing protein [Spirulina sp. CS-785/01]|uniref:SBBP repeat-containing protein n=1 Tax=Spirulina sp. CS-785/01 TaxID=3021716 RepID=UPI0023303C97|nr:SBBP repeat-containing protein [Spirulina sp. CS-785/01]MDB9314522.1 SBBP repeat-containing protein [Spirulina sp. CS-785/01]
METVKTEWVKQLGTAGEDDAYGIAVDSDGNVYMTGYTSGNLEGENAGGNDAWVAKYDPSGQQLWLKQLGTMGEDESNGIALAPDGTLYVLGYTYGVKEDDIAQTWLAKYDPQGTRHWLKRLSDSRPQIPHSLAVDAESNIYITGYAAPEHEEWQVWLAKYNPDGDRLWWTPLGQYHDEATTYITVGHNPQARSKITRTLVYVAGNTPRPISPEAGSEQAWLACYNGEGIQRWIQPLGSLEETGCSGIAIDPHSYLYLAGYTTGTVAEANAGGSDVWVARYDNQGHRQWIHQLGTTEDEEATGLTVDAVGNVYIAGFTYGAMTEEVAGDSDAWVAKYNAQGEQQWVKQIGSAAEDGCNAVAVDHQSNVYITGYTDGAMEGENAGGYDAWLAKLVQSQ